ncbi:hypothetical protein QCA50_008044 [Cerrena zonata]|uniref:polynucleotide adenylyltransferase n=1 Tax=Cerrena zonata TaxID=2478898 RepID=A0AAW0G590_9APHY
MTAVYSQRLQPLRHSPHQAQQPLQAPSQRHTSKQRFLAEFSQCLYEFVIQLLPTREELIVKEDVRKLLERLIRTIEPESRLLSFGSTANGFSLRNSDMDLCCLIDSEERLSASDLVTMLGDLLERETKFHVKPLPHARIPIVKLSLDPSPGLPYGIACDIGFENRLALENTRLLMCYALIDPPRVRTMVLFLKVWCKRRKINSPYKGTLSSYGYVLLVIFFLVHVKNPPVLPNLQQMPPMRPISQEETTLHGHNIWFFDDIELLRGRWQSSNTESVAELLVDFFRFYARDFQYNTGVASIRAGLLKKDSKGWASESDRGTARERNRLCIEDPFEVDFNVSRCVTRDGLYTIRGELMRASRILASRPERAIVALAQLCEERKDEELLQASPSRSSATTFNPPRLSPLPPQTPYTVGSNPMRTAPADRLSPPQMHDPPSFVQKSNMERLPSMVPDHQFEHMAPKRAKWTSPPPPEASYEDREAFDDQLGRVFALATASNAAREREREQDTASERSVMTDDDFEENRSLAESDDVRSIRSFTDEGVTSLGGRTQQGYQHVRGLTQPFSAVQLRPSPHQDFRLASFAQVQDPSSSRGDIQPQADSDGFAEPRTTERLKLRGRQFRLGQPQASDVPLQDSPPRLTVDSSPRRSTSGPSPRITSHRFSMPVIPMYTPQAQAPVQTLAQAQAHVIGPSHSSYSSSANHSPSQVQRAAVFYETSPLRERLSRAMAARENGDSSTPVPVVNVTPPFDLRTPSARSNAGVLNAATSTRGPIIQRSPSVESDMSSNSPKQPVVNIPRHMYQDDRWLTYDEPPIPSHVSQYSQFHRNDIPATLVAPLPPSATMSVPTSLDSISDPPQLYQPPHSYQRIHSHAHSHSTATIVPSTPTPQTTMQTTTPVSPRFPYTLDELTNPSNDREHRQILPNPPPPSTISSLPVTTVSPLPPSAPSSPFLQANLGVPELRCVSPSTDDESRSPSMLSCNSSPMQYAVSVSPISTSPPSPRHSNVKLPLSAVLVAAKPDEVVGKGDTIEIQGDVTVDGNDLVKQTEALTMKTKE